MEAIFQWMKTIVYFLLILGIFRNLISSEYQKFTRLTVGLCLVVLVASPVIKLLTKEDFSLFVKEQELSGLFEEYSAASGDSMWEDALIEEYKSLLLEQTESIAAKEGLSVTDLRLETAENEVTGITVWMKETDKETDKETQEAVETISITDIIVRLTNGNSPDGRREQTAASVRELAMSMKLADFYDCDASHIHVLIEED